MNVTFGRERFIMLILKRFLFFLLFFSFSSQAFDLKCQDIKAEGATEAQILSSIAHCEALELVLEAQFPSSRNCQLQQMDRHNELTSHPVFNIQYDITSFCEGELIDTNLQFFGSWLSNGRSASPQSIWIALRGDQQKEILEELKAEQDPALQCPDPQRAFAINIQEDVVTFTNFYPEMESITQKEACDFSIIRPPHFIESFLDADMISHCGLPKDLIEKTQKMRFLPELYLDNPDHEKLASALWQNFPQNYRELAFMAGSWWYPGWEPLLQNQKDISWTKIQDSQGKALLACNGPLSHILENQIIPAWYQLYEYVDKNQWMKKHIQLHAGLWQEGSFGKVAQIKPHELKKKWDEKAEAQFWKNIDISTLMGLYAWYNSHPDYDICDGLQCVLKDPIDPDNIELSEGDRLNLKRKMQNAKTQYLE